MHRFRLLSCSCLVGTLISTSAFAQTGAEPATTAFRKARGLYYTPVDAGLRSFHCEVGFNWKDFLQKATNQAVPDTDARLGYLQTIKLSLDDDLHSGGQLHWTAPTTAPEGTEDSVSKIRDGMQQMWSGFFQSWNGFATGDLVTLDAKATVEQTAVGYHVAVRNPPSLAEELYDKDLTLKSIHVSTPTLDSTIVPTFATSPGGLLVNDIASSYKQPPTAEPTDINMKISYATVGTFQLPSELVVTVGPAAFDYHVQNCTVNTQAAAK